MGSILENLKKTLKVWPVATLSIVAICYLTGAAADVFFGIELSDQASIDMVRRSMLALVRRLCAGAGWSWMFFGDLWALVKIVGAIVVVAPAVEEFVFRWLLWKLPRPGLPAVSAVTSSALFSAAHYIEAPWPDNAFIALFAFGLVQCWLYATTGRLWCAILNHALFNAANLVLVFVVS